MQYTNNFHLAKPDGNDKVEVAVLNSNTDILESTLTAGGGYEFSEDHQYCDIPVNIADPFSIVEGFAPDLSNTESVNIKVFSEGEVIFNGAATVMTDTELAPGTTIYGFMAFTDEGQDPTIGFYSKVKVDFATGSVILDDNASTLGLMDGFTGDLIRIEIPYTETVITPIPAKYLSESPVATFDTSERVVGTLLGEPLYERTYKLEESSSTTSETPLNISGGKIKHGYIAEVARMLYQSGTMNFYKSYTPFYAASDNYFYCELNSNYITMHCDLTERYDDYDYLTLAKVRYTKDTTPTSDVAITLPDDADGTVDNGVYGTVENKGNLGLAVGTAYKVTAEISGQTFTATTTASDYGNGIVSLSIGAGVWQAGYLNIYDNASVSSGGAVSSSVDTYGFTWGVDAGISATITIEEA